MFHAGSAWVFAVHDEWCYGYSFFLMQFYPVEVKGNTSFISNFATKMGDGQFRVFPSDIAGVLHMWAQKVRQHRRN